MKSQLYWKSKLKTCVKRGGDVDELATFKFTFPVVVYLQTNGDGKSCVYLSALLLFDFILPLVVCSHILHPVVPITAMLQNISCDLIEAVSECQENVKP